MVLGFRKKSGATQATTTALEPDHPDVPLEDAQPASATLLPVFACGAGLFSDGYINNVIGSVGTVLAAEYGDAYSNSAAISNVSAPHFTQLSTHSLFRPLELTGNPFSRSPR